jgi:hypothetical protein
MIGLRGVTVRWEIDGSITPLRVAWEGGEAPVSSVGRSWRAPDGYHVLVMLGGPQVHELWLTPELTWRMREPSQRIAG